MFIESTGQTRGTGGIGLWQDMESNQVLVGRSWQQLKERYKRSILPRLDFFPLTEEQRLELRLGWSHDITSSSAIRRHSTLPTPLKSHPSSSLGSRSGDPFDSQGSSPTSPPPLDTCNNGFEGKANRTGHMRDKHLDSSSLCISGITPLPSSSPSARFSSPLPPLDTCNNGSEGLSPMEMIRNETVREFASDFLDLCDELGDSREEMKATSKILQSRIIRPTTAPITPTPQTGQHGSSPPCSSPPCSSPSSTSPSPAAQSDPSPSPILTRSSETESPIMVSVFTQTGGGNFSCDICDFTARDGCNLRRHNDDMHKPRY